MTELPTVSNRTDFEELFPELLFPEPFSTRLDEIKDQIRAQKEGKQVRLIGQYTQKNVSKRREFPPVYQGNVAIVLEDGMGILLYPMWHPEAIRPESEITQYENRQVVVVGKLVPRAPEPPDNRASLIGPCLLTIDSISLAP